MSIAISWKIKQEQNKVKCINVQTKHFTVIQEFQLPVRARVRRCGNKHSFNEKTNEATVEVLSTKNITSQSLRARKIYDACISIRWLRVRVIFQHKTVGSAHSIKNSVK